MKRLAIFVVFYLIISINFSRGQASKWTTLFNGKDLTGWIIKNHPDDDGHHFWKVEKEMIVSNSLGSTEHDYVWLMSQEEYRDFELKLKFRTSKIPTGNSGIQIRSRYDDANAWMDGPQIDIHPPGPWRSGFIWEETREAKRWIYPDIPKGEWVNPEMRKEAVPFYFMEETALWNDLRISVKGYEIKAYLNDTQITDFNNKAILTDTPHLKYNTGTTGHIALQIHSKSEVKIYFKDIYIRKL
jgi:hypothetical protein